MKCVGYVVVGQGESVVFYGGVEGGLSSVLFCKVLGVEGVVDFVEVCCDVVWFCGEGDEFVCLVVVEGEGFLWADKNCVGFLVGRVKKSDIPVIGFWCSEDFFGEIGVCVGVG